MRAQGGSGAQPDRSSLCNVLLALPQRALVTCPPRYRPCCPAAPQGRACAAPHTHIGSRGVMPATVRQPARLHLRNKGAHALLLCSVGKRRALQAGTASSHAALRSPRQERLRQGHSSTRAGRGCGTASSTCGATPTLSPQVPRQAQDHAGPRVRPIEKPYAPALGARAGKKLALGCTPGHPLRCALLGGGRRPPNNARQASPSPPHPHPRAIRPVPQGVACTAGAPCTCPPSFALTHVRHLR